jgi:hypothetical protein
MSSASPAPDDSGDAAVISKRWPELALAGLLMLVAVAVIVDSLRIGVDWADDGPRAGYFPFYVGLLLFAASTWIAGNTLWSWRKLAGAFVTRGEFSGVWAVLWPTAVYVAAIAPLGIYLASLLLIAYFMRRHGGYALWLSLLVSAAVVSATYLLFEVWFVVLLPKGALWAWVETLAH